MQDNERRYWLDEPDPDKVAKSAIWRMILITIIAVVVIAIISAAFWAARVGTSDIKGRGDAIVQKNQANNRIAAQERFEDLIAEIKAADRKLSLAMAQVKDNPGDPTVATNYAGLVNHCEDTVAQYNAAARKYTQEQFRAADLLAEINNLDPATDCVPTTPKESP